MVQKVKNTHTAANHTANANAASGTTDANAASGTTDAAAGNVLNMVAGKGARKSIFTAHRTEVSQQAIAKVQVMQSVRQRLAEASDLFNEGEDKAIEARVIADKAAVGLYQARIDGLASGEEVSGLLGDIFGFKAKKDGTPGKTPDGQGEAIRKRVVRAVQASEYVNDGDGGRFFDGLPAEEIGDILATLEAGELSIWTAYERFAEVKRDHAVKTNAAFDPKRIAAIAEALSEEGAAEIFAANPALVASYGALIEVLAVIDEQASAIDVEAEAVAA